MPIQGKYVYLKDDLSSIFEIRNKVFNYKNEKDYSDMDEFDKEAIHVIVFSMDNNKPVATGRIIYSENIYTISKVAVLEEERLKYYGDFTVRMLATKGFMAGAETIYLDTPPEYTEFFKKIGFIVRNDYMSNSKLVSMKITSGILCKKCMNI